MYVCVCACISLIDVLGESLHHIAPRPGIHYLLVYEAFSY